MAGFALLAVIVGTFSLSHLPIDRETLESFERIERAAGREVYVLDHEGVERLGRLLAVEAERLTLEVGRGAVAIERPAVARVDRARDRIADGALKGAAVGLLAGLLACQGTTSSREAAGVVLTSVGVYGALGAWFDHRHPAREPLYRAPTAQLIATLRW